jgi:hypothetical protein
VLELVVLFFAEILYSVFTKKSLKSSIMRCKVSCRHWILAKS